jgi:hypothetical protein
MFFLSYELGFYTPEDDILHSHRRRIFKSYKNRLHNVILELVIAEYFSGALTNGAGTEYFDSACLLV